MEGRNQTEREKRLRKGRGGDQVCGCAVNILLHNVYFSVQCMYFKPLILCRCFSFSLHARLSRLHVCVCVGGFLLQFLRKTEMIFFFMSTKQLQNDCINSLALCDFFSVLLTITFQQA